MTDIILNFDKGTAHVALAELPTVMREAALKALDEGAEFMTMMARNYVRVDTHTLQSSIRKHRSHDVVRVIAGGLAYWNPKSKRPCDYAAIVEDKYPFLRPAWEATRDYVLNLIRQNVVNDVKSLER